MRILVTGSEGMIGKKIVEILKAHKHEVRGFDISKGQDVTNPTDCLQACQDIELVVHCAATLDEESKDLFKINVDGTRNIFQSAAQNGVQRVVHLSSVGVYGNATQELSEDGPHAPVTRYEQSKEQAEKVADEFQEQLGVTMLRPAIVVGPNAQWKEIFTAIKKGFPLIGSGENKWQIVHMDDVASAAVFCVEHEETTGEVYNVAAEKPSTFREVVETCYKELGVDKPVPKMAVLMAHLMVGIFAITSALTRKRPLLTFYNLERMLKNRWYSVKKLKELGWRPKYDLQASIRMTVKALRM